LAGSYDGRDRSLGQGNGPLVHECGRVRRKCIARSGDAAKAGVGFGTALAIAISWSANGSILWAIIHGILSWFYVIYYAIRY